MIKLIIISAASFLALAACKPAPKAEAPPAAATAQAQLDAEAADQAAFDAAANTAPSDPVDAYVWRVDYCAHAGGEIGGDGSQHDKDIMARMDQLNCDDSLVPDGKALRAAHADDAAVVAKIDAALKTLKDTFGG